MLGKFEVYKIIFVSLQLMMCWSGAATIFSLLFDGFNYIWMGVSELLLTSTAFFYFVKFVNRAKFKEKFDSFFNEDN